MFTVPLILGCLEKRRREAVTMGMALGDGLLQEVWFSDSSEDEGPPGRARTRPRLPRTQEVESWQENFRTIISSGVCAKSTDIHIYSQMEYEHNFLENFIRFYCTTLYFYCLAKYIFTVQTLMFITCNLFFAIFLKY